MSLFEHDIGDLLPLFMGGIYACRVVRAGVKEEDGLVYRGGERFEERGECKSDGWGVVVWVVDRCDADVLEDRVVVGFFFFVVVVRQVRKVEKGDEGFLSRGGIKRNG